MSLYSLLAGPRAQGLSLTSIEGWEPIFDSWGMRAASTGERVSPQTATAVSAYAACVRVIADDLAKVPAKVFRTRPSGGRDVVTDHSAAEVLAVRPNDFETAMAFRADFVATALGWSHGYARVDRYAGELSLHRLDPPRVRPKRDANGPFYEYRPAAGGVEIIRAEDMLDLYGVLGWSAPREGRESLGIALAEIDYAGRFLSQASAPNSIIETPQPMDEALKKKFRQDWQKMHAGSANAGSVAIFEAGMKYIQTAVNPQVAQLLESRKFSVEEICRWLRVSPHKVMERERAKGWSTLAATDTEHVVDCLMPWATRLEAVWNLRLLTQRERAEGMYVKHVLQALLRGNMKERIDFYQKLLHMGSISPNEIREFEDMNPIGPAGDGHFLPLNMAPIEKVVSGEAAAKAAPASSPGRGGPGGANDSGDGDDVEPVNARLLPIFEDACARILRKEARASARLLAGERDMEPFLKAQKPHVAAALTPAIMALTGFPVTAAGMIAHGYAEAHIDEARAAWSARLDGDSDILAWDDPGRVTAWAHSILRDLTGTEVPHAA